MAPRELHRGGAHPAAAPQHEHGPVRVGLAAPLVQAADMREGGVGGEAGVGDGGGLAVRQPPGLEAHVGAVHDGVLGVGPAHAVAHAVERLPARCDLLMGGRKGWKMGARNLPKTSSPKENGELVPAWTTRPVRALCC